MSTKEEILAAIAESDRRWPNYRNIVHYNYSGGFIDGAARAYDHHEEDARVVELAETAYPLSGETEVDAQVIIPRREGYAFGYKWVRDQS